MTSSANLPHRGKGSRIKGILKSQKPTCKVIIHRWGNPHLTGLEALNLSKSGDYFNNKAKQAKAKTSAGSFIIDNDIVKCSIHKNKNTSSGGFTLVLKRGNKGDVGQETNSNSIDYLNLINPGDWIAIYMKKDGEINFPDSDIGSNSEDSGLKMIGIIENVRFVEIDDPDTGRPRLEFVVTGRDFGKVFENEIYFNPLISSIKNLKDVLGVAFLQDSEKQMGSNPRKKLTPDQIIKNMVDFYMGGDSNTIASTTKTWFIPQSVASLVKGGSSEYGSKPFISILDKSRLGIINYNNGSIESIKPSMGETIPKAMPDSGTIWDALKQYSNPLINEMIVDLTNVNGKLVPSIQLRQIPFSNKSNSDINVFSRSPVKALDKVVPNAEKTFFVDLPKHEIESIDIKQKNVGKSDFERVNAVVVVPKLPAGISGNPVQQAYSMALNAPSIQRYGLRLLQGGSFYTYDDKTSFIDFTSKLTSLLSDWFMSSHLLYNGTIITDGVDEFVEVGQNLFIKDVRQLYQIEGISYSYEINPGSGNTIYNTEFRVSRGQLTNEDGTITDFIGVPLSLEENQGITIFSNTVENIRNKDKTDK